MVQEDLKKNLAIKLRKATKETLSFQMDTWFPFPEMGSTHEALEE